MNRRSVRSNCQSVDRHPPLKKIVLNWIDLYLYYNLP